MLNQLDLLLRVFVENNTKVLNFITEVRLESRFSMKYFLMSGVLLVILGLYLDSLVPPEIVEHRARVVAVNSIFSVLFGAVSQCSISSSFEKWSNAEVQHTTGVENIVMVVMMVDLRNCGL